MAFIPEINPRYESPYHLAPLVDLLTRAETQPIRALVSVPPQFAKSHTILAGLAWHLRRNPAKRHAYATFAADFSMAQSRLCRDMAREAGVILREDAHSTKNWLTSEGGGLFATSVGGQLTGKPVDGLLVVDDPHKSREEAESLLERDRVGTWFDSDAHTRVHPGGGIIICHTRWTVDDLIGRLSKERNEDGTPVWEVVNLPAILPDGTPLWHRRPLDFLAKARQRSEYDWWSLYMGSPRPKGEAVFHKATYYEDLPKVFRIGKGTDLAYTAKTRADYSCALVLLEGGKNERGLPLYYVAEVRRAQCEVPVFVATLAGLNETYAGSWHWFCSTTEKGVAQVVSDGESGVTIDPVLATADKFVRAQPVAAAWNDGRVLVPRNAPWLKAFVDELGAFTGVGDRHDDHVDALASAFTALEGSGGTPTVVSGTGTRWGDSTRGF